MSAYYPCLVTKQAEIKALKNLDAQTRGRLSPILSLQAWPIEKAGFPSLVRRSLVEYNASTNNLPALIDLADPRDDRPESEGILKGAAEISDLHDPLNGFAKWRALVSEHPHLTPVVQWIDLEKELNSQVAHLLEEYPLLALRFRRSAGWNLLELAKLETKPVEQKRKLIILDCEQISRFEDLSLLALNIQAAARSIAEALNAENSEFVLIGSSFPSQFSDIDETHARLFIRERQLFDVVSPSKMLLDLGMKLQYGDYASVFCGLRETQFRGRPRIDYPSANRWTFERRTVLEGYVPAAQAIVNGVDWDDSILCWGAQAIRTAASGNIIGLGSQSAWSAVRINLHLFQQSYFGENKLISTDEPWQD